MLIAGHHILVLKISGDSSELQQNYADLHLIRFCNEFITGSGQQTDSHTLEIFVSPTPGCITGYAAELLNKIPLAEPIIRFANTVFI